jgi:hypothetical protein
MLYALVIGAVLLHLLWATRGGRAAGKQVRIVPWLRALGWSILAMIVIALVAGFAGFAAFVATRLVSGAVVLGVPYLLVVLVLRLIRWSCCTCAGELFACRRCYRLTYASQLEAPHHPASGRHRSDTASGSILTLGARG